MSISLDSWNPQTGETKLLKRGETYTLTAVKNITGSNITLKAEPGMGAWPIIQFKTVFPSSSNPSISVGKGALSFTGGSDIVINNISFDAGTTKNYGIRFDSCKRVVLSGFNVVAGGGALEIVGTKDSSFSDVYAEQRLRRYLMILFQSGGAQGDTNRVKWNERCTFKRIRAPFGSQEEHCVRIHGTANTTFEDVYVDNSWTTAKQAWNVRDTDGITLKNFKIRGYTILGPLPTDNGADDIGARTKNLVLKSGTMADGANQLLGGVENFLIEDVCVKNPANHPGFQIEGDFQVLVNGVVKDVRKKATGTFRRVKFTGPQPFVTGRSSGQTYEDCTRNGVAYT